MDTHWPLLIREIGRTDYLIRRYWSMVTNSNWEAARESYIEWASEHCHLAPTLVHFCLHNIYTNPKAMPSGILTEKFDTVKIPVSKDMHSHFGMAIKYHLFDALAINDSPLPQIELYAVVSTKIMTTIVSDISDMTAHVKTEFDKLKQDFRVKRVYTDLLLVHQQLAAIVDLFLDLGQKRCIIILYKLIEKLIGGKDNRKLRAQFSMTVAVAREQGWTVVAVGLLAPWKRPQAFYIHNLSLKWDHADILTAGLKAATDSQNSVGRLERWNKIIKQYKVGNHVPKSTALTENLNIPFQIFLYGNMPGEVNERRGEEEWKAYPPGLFKDKRAYIHAPYTLNLASDKPYVVISMLHYMTQATKYGFKGVVFHCGICPDIEHGVTQMRKNINSVLDQYSGSAWLLLETSCGKKNELLHRPEDFDAFVQSVPRVAVCVDTCHTFVSGTMPLDFLAKLSDPSRIKLIHFNGAWKPFGCRADGHAYVGVSQNIPDDQLIGTLEFAKKYKIDAVIE